MAGIQLKNCQACKQARKYDHKWGEKSINSNRPRNDTNDWISRQVHQSNCNNTLVLPCS